MPEEAGTEEKKEKKKQKSKSKHKKVQVWKFYKIEGGKVVRLKEFCPRCGAGTFLAKDGNRTWCGRCGWAQIKRSEEK